MNDQLIDRLRSFQSYIGKESVESTYEMAQACLEAADEIERLEKEQDELIIVGSDGTEVCRWSGEEATAVIQHAVTLAITDALFRAKQSVKYDK